MNIKPKWSIENILLSHPQNSEMKKIITILTFAFFSINSFGQSAVTFHNYSAESILGDTINFSQYYGKKVLVVNTASFCGYTPQFADLESLYTQYQQYNFEIIGFPCNDFNNQDPHDDSTINQFCTSNYGVTFQMMSKIATISADTSPVYKWLQRQNLNGVADAHVAWNFNKFCIDEAGHWVAHYIQTVNPLDAAITDWIMSPSVISSVNDVSIASDNLIQLNGSNSDNTTINLKLRNTGSEKIRVNIFSIDGKFISTIYNGNDVADQTIIFSTSNLSSGIYIVNALTNNSQQTIKFAVVK